MSSMRALYLVLLVGVGCADGGFAPLPQDTAGTRVIGRVLALDGTGVADARVFAVQDGIGVVSARTDATGAYAIDGAPTGPLEVFAHAAADGGALEEVVAYGGGDNRAPDLYVGPFGEHPRLVDYRNIDFEERLTTARSDLSLPHPEAVRGWSVPEGRVPLVRTNEQTRKLVEVDLETGEETERLETDLFTYVIGGRLSLERTEDETGWHIRDAASREIIATVDGRIDPTWIPMDDRTIVFQNDLRLVVVDPDGTVRTSPDILPPVSSAMLFVARYGDHLFYRSENRFSRMVRFDPATLDVEPWVDILDWTQSPPHYTDTDEGEVHFLRGSVQGRFVRVTIDLETRAIRESHEFRPSEPYPRLVGPKLIDIAPARTQLLRVEPDGTVTAPVASGPFDPRAEGYLIAFEPTEVTVVHIASGDVRRVRYADLDVEAPPCGDLGRCSAVAVDGYPAIVERGPDDDSGAIRIVEIQASGQAVVHEIEGYDYLAGVTYGDGLNAVTANDGAGTNQTFVFATGDPSLIQATFLDSRHRTVLGIRGRRLYYIARDPISGNTQLFGRTL